MTDDPQTKDPDLAPGTEVGEYRIEAKLGEGGFGIVYRAVHPLIGKTAAVKVLGRQWSANPEMLSRFVAEARAVNQIRHRNIIDIFSFGQLPNDGRAYYVMELLDGVTFDTFLDEQGPLPVAKAVPILRQVAKALDAAHAAGIAHRDLKPENIFLVVEPDGSVFPKLLDFGIAKLLSDSSNSHKTRTGTPMGTPHYMSPEQCRGKDIDHRTDIYSFGVMVFKVLTGHVPFDGDDVLSIMVKHTTTPPPRASEKMPDLPAEVDEVLVAMMAKEPADRPVTIVDAVAALAEAAGVEQPSGPSFRVGRSGKQQIGEAKTMLGSTTSAETQASPTLTKPFPVVPVVVGALLVAAAGATFLFTRGGEPTAPVPAATSAPPSEPPKPKDPPAASSVVVAPVAAAQTVTITVQGAPPAAEVYAGSEKLGRASSPVTLPRGDVAVKLAVKADGYKPFETEITPKSDMVLQAQMTRLVKAQAKSPGEIENPFK